MNEKPQAGTAAPAQNKMGVMPMGRLMATMSLPLMVSLLVQSLYNMVGAALRQLVVLVPCAWLLARFGGVGAIWYALWAAEAAAAVYSALAFRRELRRKVEPLRPAR